MSSAEILLLSAIEDNDELVLISTEMNQSHGNVYNGEKMNLEVLTNEQCRFMFRFEKQDIDILRVALGIPSKIVCNNGTVASGIEGLCIVLRRLTYPNRLEDISPIFQRPLYELSYILSKTLDIIYDNTSQKLTSLDQEWLSEEYLRTFAEVIHERGSPLLNCWGFIDGTVMPICRPTRHQRIVYSGHKRVHGLKFQSVVAPNGLVANLFGPIEGRRHDSGMLRESGLMNQLEGTMNRVDGTPYSLYGDPAYPLRPHLIAPYRGAALTAEEQEFNKLMSAVRVSVEWTFGKVISLFAFLDFKKNLKMYLQPVGKYYVVATIFSKCHTCLYGSETGTFFGLNPPTLEEYPQ
ncbi:unnamed protein product [Mytilus coruscus]|uniref:DDE Tnp4 domain-containing protein n=1 Tax=Mytilus coruscus TaxID=42192 RepID=A0A6J8CHJ9_MYTCO|nr:unnamed protein product [Mytilus coruscus]